MATKLPTQDEISGVDEWVPVPGCTVQGDDDVAWNIGITEDGKGICTLKNEAEFVTKRDLQYLKRYLEQLTSLVNALDNRS